MSATEVQQSKQEQPASTLPPRKRAKTQEEKEQRRIERILRNRRAAHASREKKRRHVEFLENHVMDMDSVMNVYKERDSINSAIQAELIQLLKDSNMTKELANLQKKIEELPVIPKLKMETASLLDSNKRSNKKQKATPKPRPIVLKKEELYSDEDEDEEDDDDEDDEDDDREDSPMTEAPSIIVTKDKSAAKEGVYLSPPTSNLDSTSPSNLSLELNSKMNDDYYMSNPLFDDLDKHTDDFFATNLQIKHEEDDDDEFLNHDLIFSAPPPQQQQQHQNGTNQPDTNESGFKMMHHPAVVMVNPMRLCSCARDIIIPAAIFLRSMMVR